MSDTTIYLIRHAIAEERGDDWPNDDLRPLTEDGVQRFTRGVRGFLTLAPPPDRVFSSPLARARQTAELLAGALAPPVTVELMKELSPGYTPSTVLTQVRKLADTAWVALVGHEPDLGHLAAHLLGTTRPIPFKKGGMCRIDIAWGRPPTGTLVWLLPPKALGKLGQTAGSE